MQPLNFCCDWQLLSRRDQLNGQLGKLGTFTLTRVAATILYSTPPSCGGAEEEKAKLQRELEKQDLSVHEVSDKLINTTNLVNTKSRDVADVSTRNH
jgi:arginine deiminase